MEEYLRKYIRDVPDFPKPGIIFKDITPLLQNPEAFTLAMKTFGELALPLRPQKIIGTESRGFIFGAPLAYLLGCGFVPIRKPGKLPAEVESEEYTLEYGTDRIEVHKDAIKKGDRVLIIDDLLATGGTISAARNLVKRLGGELVECAFVVELVDLKGREKIKGEGVYSIVEFEGE